MTATASAPLSAAQSQLIFRAVLDALARPGTIRRLPAAARKDYTFRSPAPSLAADRRATWDRALAGLESARLTDAARAFDQNHVAGRLDLCE